jgi:electron transfer flavoprotein alpha subunit
LSADVIELTAPDVVAGDRLTHLREILPPPEALDITEAEVVVAGGAGVGGREGFALLNQLAGRLGGTLAASRVAVDRGWVPRQRQVGQTGKSVAPKVYLAFGISGAPQHIAGIRNAGKVVAVNRDPRAPIFEVADLAVAADLYEVVPALIERLDERNRPDAPERR